MNCCQHHVAGCADSAMQRCVHYKHTQALRLFLIKLSLIDLQAAEQQLKAQRAASKEAKAEKLRQLAATWEDD